MKIAILVGTRPEIIKMSPVIRLLQNHDRAEIVLIHSNQHYSKLMDEIFFQELDLPCPDFNLNIAQDQHANQIGTIMIRLEPILREQKVDVLLVQGDTNTVAAGALVASKLGIKLGHVEAGLRSYDKSMPEEGNRIITDHLSDYLFAVTDKQVEILKSEGIDKKNIYKVGNTIVDAVFQNLKIAEQKSEVLKKYSLTKKDYSLVTAHRAGNVDTKPALMETLEIISMIPGKAIWPVHLRTLKNLKLFGLELPENVIQTEPLGYFDFLSLMNNARLIVTDSGGLQEEACILGVPCLTIRENTERPETLDVGSNVLVGRDKDLFKKALEELPDKWENPFGQGNTSELILDALFNDFSIPVFTTKERVEEKVCVVGMGYMGIPTSLLMANQGYRVTGIDVNSEKVKKLQAGELPFEEEGMDHLFEKVRAAGRFNVQTELCSSDIFIVAVPTPHIGQKCDLKYLISACENLTSVLEDNNIVIIESTIKPNTCAKVLKPILDKSGKQISILHCPERAIPGNTLYELVHNDRIIGGDDKTAVQRARALYSSFVRGDIFETSLINAECAKLMENTFRDVNIALANEFSIISKDVGFDTLETIRLANRHPRVNILEPGPGVGGHCIPIDPWFLTEDTDSAKLIRAAREVNDFKPIWFVDQIIQKKNLNPSYKIAILGVAYKKDIDDARETPAETIYERFQSLGFEVRAHDPHVKLWDYPLYSKDDVVDWADYLVVVTHHHVFNKYIQDYKEKVIHSF